MESSMQQHLFGVYQTLRARIELINHAIGHTVTQGAETESDIRDLLTSVLPSTYGIGTGKIVGTDGKASRITWVTSTVLARNIQMTLTNSAMNDSVAMKIEHVSVW